MSDDPQSPVVIPTELERRDGFLDLAAVVGMGLADWELWLHGLPVVWLVLPTLAVATWTLTGEAAADVPYVGAIAAGLRSKLGLRRAHEWVQAFAHYFRVRVWPDWRSWCGQSWRSSRQAITRWRLRASAQIKWNRSRAYSWASRIRSS